MPHFFSTRFKKLSINDRSILEAAITLEEVKTTVWKRGADKAPSPMHLHFHSSKKWETIGGDIFFAIKELEKTEKIEKECNSLFIILVPKITYPYIQDDFRPIGFVYKIISKVLAKRLKVVIDKVIIPTETTFIKNCSILDGPLIVNEIISWLMKSKTKAFVFKVNFEKDFDCVNLKYLDSII